MDLDLGVVSLIWTYSGTPGSGKSAHLARTIRKRLNKKDPGLVIANFPLSLTAPVKQRETYIYIPNVELDASEVIRICEAWWQTHEFHEESILLALDEVQMLFNSREWSSKGNKRMQWLELFSQSRKIGLKVVFVAQNIMMIDNQFRMLVEYDVLHRKVGNYGLFGYLLSLPFGGRLTVQTTIYFPLKQRLESEWGIISKKDIAMYDSYARFARSDGGMASARESGRASAADSGERSLRAV